jgi:uncharacterized protein YifN (PemK superfamily)
MTIREHPAIGSILMCDFDGYRQPEMVKRRPVVVISPKIAARQGLCTVVALSTTAPSPVAQYHCQIDIRPHLPGWLQSDGVWIKGDMIAVVAFDRLDFVQLGKDHVGKRRYYYSTVGPENLRTIRRCVLSGMGLAHLTKHL